MSACSTLIKVHGEKERWTKLKDKARKIKEEMLVKLLGSFCLCDQRDSPMETKMHSDAQHPSEHWPRVAERATQLAVYARPCVLLVGQFKPGGGTVEDLTHSVLLYLWLTLQIQKGTFCSQTLKQA